jgi:hypothetical protein
MLASWTSGQRRFPQGKPMGTINLLPYTHKTSLLIRHHSFQVRTLEILDSFGVGERVWKESNHMVGARIPFLRMIS